MKTEIISLRQVGGSYDANCTIVRNVSDEMVFFVNSGSIRIKDGRLITSGNIYCDGTGIGSSVMGAVIRFVNPNIIIESPMRFNSNVYLGWDGNSYELTLLDPVGALSIELAGTEGTGTFKGQVVVNPGTQAVPAYVFDGDLDNGWFSSVANYISYASNNSLHCVLGLQNTFYRDTRFTQGIKISHGNDLNIYSDWLTTLKFNVDGATGDLTSSGDADFTASDSNVKSFSKQMVPSFTALPAASASNVGTLRILRDAADGDRDKLYVCLRSSGAEAYSWVLVSQGL